MIRDYRYFSFSFFAKMPLHVFALFDRMTSAAKLWNFEWNPADYLKQP